MGPVDAAPTALTVGMREALRACLDGVRGLGRPGLRFRCNVCGRHARAPLAQLTREERTCACGSTVRQRALILALSRGLFGEGLAIPDFPARPDLVGVDMSGGEPYARRLPSRLGYVNTFLHQEPQLDITAPSDAWRRRCDFVLSSDVFEHVAPPVQRAFDNTFELLKDGGLFVLTVPYTLEAATREHFPELHAWRLEARGGRRVLLNRTRDGRDEAFDALVFHGGEGETLEMRVFSEAGVLANLRQAGFQDIRVHGADDLAFGVAWRHPWSLPITARRPA